MKIQEFLKLAGQPGRLNLFVVCPDELGLQLLLQEALADTTAPDDLMFFDAEGITKDRAREIENEARTAPRGGSALQTIFIYSLQKLPTESVGPLLKATEDARWTRLIFQAQSVPRKIYTLRSRASTIQLPFLSKDLVLATLKGLEHDAKTADQLDLYDGTISGTIRNLRMKDTLTAIRRELSKGARGISALFYLDEDGNGYLTSNAFRPAIDPYLTPAEAVFLREGTGREISLDRRKIVTHRIATRIRAE